MNQAHGNTDANSQELGQNPAQDRNDTGTKQEQTRDHTGTNYDSAEHESDKLQTIPSFTRKIIARQDELIALQDEQIKALKEQVAAHEMINQISQQLIHNLDTQIALFNSRFIDFERNQH